MTWATLLPGQHLLAERAGSGADDGLNWPWMAHEGISTELLTRLGAWTALGGGSTLLRPCGLVDVYGRGFTRVQGDAAWYLPGTTPALLGSLLGFWSSLSALCSAA